MDAVQWRVVWETAGLEPPTQGGAWQVSRADGGRLELLRGWMVLSTVVVESCETWSPARTPPPHGRPDHASGLEAPVAVSLHDLEDQTFPEASFPEEEVCGVWVISFQGGEGLSNPPPELDAVEDADLATLAWWAEVAVQDPATGAWSELVIGSPLQIDADLRPTWQSETARVASLHLDPTQLLAGLTLPIADPGLAGFEALEGLLAAAVVEITDAEAP